MQIEDGTQVIIKRDILGEPNMWDSELERKLKVGVVKYHTGSEYVITYLGNEFACTWREIERFMPSPLH